MADLHVDAAVAGRGVDASFDVAAGEVVAMLGPNGAGKSTIASVIAGMLCPDRGVVRVGDRTLTDTRSGTDVAIHRRRVGVLMQEPLLFPHLSALGNVRFAVRGRADAESRAHGWLERVGAGDLAGFRPDELSGGQAQRVALARALAAEPEVLLLDEPLRGLDVSAAGEIRAVLRGMVTEGAEGSARPVLMITHDLLDVLALADRVLVLDGGRIAEGGPVAEVLAAPRSAFGARIAGVNVVRGIPEGASALRDADGGIWHGVSAGPLGSAAVAVFSPASVAVYPHRPHGSPRNCVQVRLAALEVTGSVVRVRAADQPDGTPGLAADVTAEAVAELRLAVGLPVWFSVKTQEVGLHAALRGAPREA